ncbi:hypothetical protein M0805_001263 [Coniferiporia weirii]|nr:hypothetical protein M0805_001263 [Coniferiporia weirii]
MFTDTTETLSTILKYVQEGQAVQVSTFINHYYRMAIFTVSFDAKYTALATVGVLVVTSFSEWCSNLMPIFQTYDWLITFCDEVDLVWYSKWNSGKLLFFATRYLAFVDSATFLTQVRMNVCANSFAKRLRVSLEVVSLRVTIIPPDLTILGVVFAELLMITRVYALWGSSRPILLFLTCSIGVVITVILIIKDENLVYGPPALGLPPCTLTYMNTKPYYTAFALLMVLECIVMLLTFWKGIVHCWQISTIYGKQRLIDGALYFSLLFALSATNFVVLLRGRFYNGNYHGILTGVQRMLHSVVMSRMILNLREAAMDRQCQVALTSLDFQPFVSSDPDGPEDTRMSF